MKINKRVVRDDGINKENNNVFKNSNYGCNVENNRNLVDKRHQDDNVDDVDNNYVSCSCNVEVKGNIKTNCSNGENRRVENPNSNRTECVRNRTPVPDDNCYVEDNNDVHLEPDVTNCCCVEN